jgi:hypothetical protein
MWFLIAVALAAPEARWQFEGNTNDDIGGFNLGTAAGSVTYSDGAAVFDGTAALFSNSAASLLPGSGSFSWIARVTPRSFTGTHTIASFYECGAFCPSGVANSSVRLNYEGSAFSLRVRDDAGVSVVLIADPSVIDETYTVMGVVDRTEGVARLIVDDTVYETALPPGFQPLSNTDSEVDPLTVGARTEAGGPGYIDRAQIELDYLVFDDEALDSDNVGSHWLAPTGLPQTACLPWAPNSTGVTTIFADYLELSTTSFSQRETYRHAANLLDTTGRFWLEADMRVLSSNNQSGWNRRVSQISICTDVNTGMSLEIGNGELLFRNGDNSVAETVVTDTSAFHEYRFDVDPFEETVQLSIDGVDTTTVPLFTFSQHCGSAGIFFGNGSILSSGVTQWRSVRHNAGIGPDADGDGWLDDCGDPATCGDGVCSVIDGEDATCPADCTERCDASDNDLDGDIDEDNVCACRTGTFNGSDYQACLRQVTRDQAQSICEMDGYDLVTLATSLEDDDIQTRLENAFPGRIWWIGANDRDAEGSFLWPGGTPLTYEAFAPGQPDDFGGDQDCVGMRPDQGLWYDMRCDRQMSFVCER